MTRQSFRRCCSQGTVIRADRFSVGLNPGSVTTDVAEFEQALRAAARAESALERAQHLTTAVELYQGPLLPGFYEDWIPTEQERLSGLFFDAAGAVVSHLESIGDTHAALTYTRHAVAVDPLREDGQRSLIRLLAADGQPASALRSYKEYERLLGEETGEEPSAALRSLVRQIEESSGGIAPSPESAVIPRKPPRHTRVSPSFGPATMTFLMTDIVGSARHNQTDAAYAAAHGHHHALLGREFARFGGEVVQETGDGFVAVFASAGSAVACAVAAQEALAQAAWPKGAQALLVRMALHTGDVQKNAEDGRYQGIALDDAARMLTAANGGQILASEATASLVRGTAEEGIRLVDLGVYRLRDVPDARRIFQVDYAEMGRHNFGPLAAEAGYKANVPQRFTRFFGRDEEIARLRTMLFSARTRLVTVTGPGGNGKTRLSLEVAERLAEAYSGSVYFVALQDLTDPSLITEAILDSLGVRRAPNRDSLAQAIEALSEKPTLLVLDNFEHLLEGGPDVVQTLLTRVRSLKLLTTSRSLLGLPAEREFVLPPMPVPGTEESLEQLSLYDSVQLFIDRAQQVIPYFQVSNANAAAVAALVGGLEGIPLAIELAAARVQVLSPAQMLAQLSHRLDYLASRKRGVSERQRTLRGALDWSYRLLPPELQRFFNRVSVFRGGWSVEAAEHVCEEPLALDYLEQLRECSLIIPAESDSKILRFRMLETLREYAQERLAESREMDALRDRHLSYFLAFAEEAALGLTGPLQKAWFERLESDHDNLRSSLSWSLSTDAEKGLRLCGALYRFWDRRGHFNEGRRWCGEAIGQAAEPEQTVARATALIGAGILAWRQSDYRAAQVLLEEGLAIGRVLNNPSCIASALDNLGTVALQQGHNKAAREFFEESLAITRESGERRGIAQALSNLGLASYIDENHEAARALHEEALAIRREIGDLSGIAASLGNLGLVAFARREYDAAQAFVEEFLATAHELGNKLFIAHALDNLGRVAYARGDYAKAQTLRAESLELCRELGNRRGMAYSLEAFGLLAAATQQWERAARLFGAAEALREAIGVPLPPAERGEAEAQIGIIRDNMGGPSFDAAWQEGRTMDSESAIALALE